MRIISDPHFEGVLNYSIWTFSTLFWHHKEMPHIQFCRASRALSTGIWLNLNSGKFLGKKVLQKIWECIKDIIIDSIVEYLGRLRWRLVATWILIILYVLDSSFCALCKAIKRFLDPLKLTEKMWLILEKRTRKNVYKTV